MLRPITVGCLATIAVTAHAQLVLPWSGIDSTATLSSFQITKSGTAGRANTLYITNVSNTSDVLLVNTVGLGKAAYFSINNAANSTQALRAESNGSGVGIFGFMTGTGKAGSFRIINAASTNSALHAQTNGSGPAFYAQAGTGLAGYFQGNVGVTGEIGGNGIGLTNLNASNIASGTLSAARLPNPLSLTGEAGSAIIEGVNTAAGGTGVRGSGTMGVAGVSSEGFGQGVFGQSTSVTGSGVYGYATANSGANVGVYGVTNSPDGFALYGAGNAIVTQKVGIGSGAKPLFPLDFPESLGDKISLFGTDPSAHYGFGIQSGLLQIYSDTQTGSTGFGYGGSGNFTERARFTSDAELMFRPDNSNFFGRISTPNDLLISKDRDNNNTDVWVRVFADGLAFEQMRIDDGDEAETKFDGAVTANGIDFAEAFKVTDSSLEPGDLVVNHGTDWEYISRSRGAYDQAVIGVISTKPAFVAGMSFNAEDKMDPDLTRRRDEARRMGDEKLEKKLTKQMAELVKKAYRPVAFMGRVPVKVFGAVKRGDRLSASNYPGVAMAMTRAGHSVGIALEENAGGFGKIMVMIQPGLTTPVAVNQGGNGVGTAQQGKMQAQLDRVLAENAELRARLDRLERALTKR